MQIGDLGKERVKGYPKHTCVDSIQCFLLLGCKCPYYGSIQQHRLYCCNKESPFYSSLSSDFQTFLIPCNAFQARLILKDAQDLLPLLVPHHMKLPILWGNISLTYCENALSKVGLIQFQENNTWQWINRLAIYQYSPIMALCQMKSKFEERKRRKKNGS